MTEPTPIETELPILPGNFRKGLIAVTVVSSVSLVTTLSLLIYLAFTRLISNSKRTKSPIQGLFWLNNLFIADFLQSIGLSLDAYEIGKNSVLPGNGCNAQGFFINIGDVASAWWTLLITLHTFLVIAGGHRIRNWVIEKSISGNTRWILSSVVWVGVFFISTVGLFLVQNIEKRGPFYNFSGAGWCWIGNNYFWYRIFFHYVFLFFNLLVLPILYWILFFIIRRQTKRIRQLTSSYGHSSNFSTLQSDEELAKVTSHQSTTIVTPTDLTKSTSAPSVHFHNSPSKRLNNVSNTLLCYPIAYICCILPITSARIAQFTGAPVPIPVVFFAAGFYASTGFVNVILYTLTRKGIVSFERLQFWRRRSGNSP